MWDTTRGVLTDAVRDLVRSWKPQALTSIAYKAIAFAILSPAAALLIRWLLPATHDRVITDAEILTIFVTTRGGFLALIVGGAVLAEIVALETACLMAIGIAATRDRHLVARDAILFGATRVPYVLGLTAHMVVRVLGLLVPFLLVIGLVYLGFLRRYDINYYLACASSSSSRP